MASRSRQGAREVADPNLIDQQLGIQQNKGRVHTLQEYEELLFGLEPNAVKTFIEQRTGATSLRALIKHVSRVSPNGLWPDMGGGHAIAMREARRERIVGHLALLNVDLFDWGDIPIVSEEWNEFLIRSSRDVLSMAYRPRLLRADAQSVRLPGEASLITAVQIWQYLDCKIESWAHWYNLLGRNALMLVACDAPFTELAQQEGLAANSLMDAFLRELDEHDIPHAYAQHSIPDIQVSVLAIERRPGTSLQPTARTHHVIRAIDGYSTAVYQNEAGAAPIRVVEDPNLGDGS